MYVHKGAAEFLYRELTVATYLGGGGGGGGFPAPSWFFIYYFYVQKPVSLFPAKVMSLLSIFLSFFLLPAKVMSPKGTTIAKKQPKVLMYLSHYEVQ